MPPSPDQRRWRTAGECELRASDGAFWDAIDVWTDKAHVIDRRLCGVHRRFSFTVVGVGQETETWSAAERISDAVALALREGRWAVTNVGDWRIGGGEESEFDLRVQVRDMLVKRPDKYATRTQIAIFDDRRSTALYLPVVAESDADERERFGHAFRLDRLRDRLLLLVPPLATDTEWMRTRVLPKIAKWASEAEGGASTRRPSSLCLVPTQRYFESYRRLKDSYGRRFVEMWTERTDPAKFVHEDVAIAAYLLVLWEEERKEEKTKTMQSFADLGCGNGLLVHILASEGHHGVGFDVKKRKIWDLYGPGTDLRELAVVPTANCPVVPDCDWLIGNHSDELTPWIPVMASRIPNTRFFVLPCCPYDFDGKFQRAASSTSRYRSYLDYVRSVGEVCGYRVSEDRLRIPSTKRVCLVGRDPCPDREAVERRVAALLAERRRPGCEAFVARPADEPIRNCTRLDAGLKESIIATVVQFLLAADTGASVNDASDGDDVRVWRPGGSASLADVARVIDAPRLARLRNECGGLKTLLKNHYHVFEVCRDSVRMRNYAEGFPVPRNKKPSATRRKPADNAKTKPCWFHENYPYGCPVAARDCAFLHRDAINHAE